MTSSTPPAQSQPEAALLDPTLEANLKSTLWYQIGRLVDDETINLGINATPQYIGSLSELVWAQLVSVAGDIEAFARHRTATSSERKRTAGGRDGDGDGGSGGGGGDKACIIKVDDVLLLGRRNEGLKGILLDEVKRLMEAKEKEKEKSKGKSKS